MSILEGGPRDAEQAYSPYVSMPAFDGMLSNTEVAALATYLRARWGGAGGEHEEVPFAVVSKLRGPEAPTPASD